jgi:hypothetical protein
MDTLFPLISALLEFGSDDRISTHPLENFLGLLRRLPHERNIFDEFLHETARNCAVHQVLDELVHPRDICGGVNLGGIASCSEGGINVILSFAASHVFEGMTYFLGMPALLDQPDNELEIQCIIDTFDWIIDMHNGSVNPSVEKGSRFIICRTPTRSFSPPFSSSGGRCIGDFKIKLMHRFPVSHFVVSRPISLLFEGSIIEHDFRRNFRDSKTESLSMETF